MLDLYATPAEVSRNLIEVLRTGRSSLIELVQQKQIVRLYWCGDASSLYENTFDVKVWNERLNKLAKNNLKLLRICTTKSGTLIKIEALTTQNKHKQTVNLAIFD